MCCPSSWPRDGATYSPPWSARRRPDQTSIGCHRNVSDRTSPPGTDFVRLVRERNAIGEASEPLMCGRRFSYRCEPAAHQPPRQPESAVG